MSLAQSSSITVGPYEILHLLGEGGMAQVFLCVRRGTGQFEKRVVLKVLHPEFIGNPEYVSMFIHEARVLARLRHPNIVDVYEVDQVAQFPYFAMEYVNGPTLGRLHRRARETGKYELGYLLHVLYQVCLGLHHAHTLVIDGRPAGIVHRDVSTQNILVDAVTGTAKLIDFGIAKGDEEHLKTQVGVLKGKLPYMAPEVLRGQRADARADVYAVGVLLYRLVTDRLPFADGDDLWPARMAGRYPRPSQLVPSVSPQMEAIIDRALQGPPERRYQSAEELAIDLAKEIDRLGTNVRLMPQWLRSVFPGGEIEWSRRPGEFPTRGTAHSALSHLITSNSASGVIQPPARPMLFIAVAGFAALLGFGALAMLGAILLALGPTSGGGRRDEVVTYLDAADDLIRQNQVEAAREMNARAEALGPEEVDLVVRLANQKGAIERREAVLRASDRIQAGKLEEARQILVATLERFPSDDELRSQLSTLEELMREPPAPKAAPVTPAPPSAPPTATAVTLEKAQPQPAAAVIAPPEPAPPAPAPQEPAALGEIRVTTTPPSLIALDGALVGLSPVTIPGVTLGAHEIEARLAGYRIERVTVDVVSGSVTPVQLELQTEAAPVAPAPSLAVAVAPVEPAPVEPAPVPKASPKDELPRPSEVTTPYAMHAALAPIQEALVNAGVDASLAKAVLADLESSSVPRLEAGQVLRVNPRAIYDLVLEQSKSGATRRDIQVALRKAFQSGALD